MANRSLRRFSLCLLCIAVLAGAVSAPGEALAQEVPEKTDGYYTIKDENNRTLCETGFGIQIGDQFLAEDNRLYEIAAVVGDIAIAKFIRKEVVSWQPDNVLPVAAPDVKGRLVVLYYSHSDESYVPTDGSASIPGKGTVMEVGAVLADNLAKYGYIVENDRTLHDPHDAGAYDRSRRTVFRLLQKQPVALFDIHRDSAPAHVYRREIGGKPTARIMLVVGRQNQNAGTTLEYAKKLKAVSDTVYPGLIRGIFIAHGNYNQDLTPRGLLIEIGTSRQPRTEAERAAALFADVVPKVIGLPPQAAGTGPKATGPGGPIDGGTAGKTIGLILAVTVIGAGAYLLLSTGGLEEAKKKLAQLRNFEFTNLLGLMCRRKKIRRKGDKEGE